MASFKNTTFLKVLAVVAWADGEMTESEKNILKKFYRKFGLNKQSLSELGPYLNAPIPKEDQEQLFKQLAAELGSKTDKKMVSDALNEMANADKKVTSEERKLLEEFAQVLQKSNFTKRSFGKIRNFFHGKIFKPARERNPELNKYFKNIVMKQLELKKGNSKVNLDEDDVYFICLFGTLLASVAHIDDHFDESEKKAIKNILKERFEFSTSELKLLFQVIEGQAKAGFDFHEVVSEFNRLYSYNEREKTVDCFFAVAGADGNISHEESEEIRRITKAMHIPHSVFKEGKKKILKQIRG